MRSFFLPVPIWQRKVLILVKGTPKQWCNAIRRHKMGRGLRSSILNDPPAVNEVACVYEDMDHGRFILYFNTWDDDTIGHEVTHLSRKILKYIGARGEEEAHGYTFEWLKKEVKRRLRSVKK